MNLTKEERAKVEAAAAQEVIKLEGKFDGFDIMDLYERAAEFGVRLREARIAELTNALENISLMVDERQDVEACADLAIEALAKKEQGT